MSAKQVTPVIPTVVIKRTPITQQSAVQPKKLKEPGEGDLVDYDKTTKKELKRVHILRTIGVIFTVQEEVPLKSIWKIPCHSTCSDPTVQVESCALVGDYVNLIEKTEDGKDKTVRTKVGEHWEATVRYIR